LARSEEGAQLFATAEFGLKMRTAFYFGQQHCMEYFNCILQERDIYKCPEIAARDYSNLSGGS